MKYFVHQRQGEIDKPYHIAENDTTPLCRNGGMRLQSWNLIEADEPPQYVCGACRRIQAAREAHEGV